MNVPAAREIVIRALAELGVDSPALSGEATLLKNAQFAGRRFDFVGGYSAAWFFAEGVIKVWGPPGLLREIAADGAAASQCMPAQRAAA